MLASLERGDRHFGMEGVRGGDRDDVDIGIGDHGAPVAGASRKPSSAAFWRAESRVDLAKMHQARPRHIAEGRRDGVPGQRMALAHIAGADQADTDPIASAHVIPPHPRSVSHPSSGRRLERRRQGQISAGAFAGNET